MGEGRHPGLARLREPDRPEQQGERRGYSTYRLDLRRDQSGNPLRENEQLVNGYGTHIYLAELAGSDSVSVKIDVPGAGWVEMEEGDILSREFTRFWVRSNSRFGDVNSFRTLGGPAEATFYVSTGPMILRAPKKYGLRAGFFGVGGTATAAGVDAFGGFATQYAALFPKGLPAFLKYGGTMIVQNRSATDTLYLFQGAVGSFNSGSGLYPSEVTSLQVPAGSTLPLLVENRIANLRHPDGAGRLNTLVAAAATGKTVDFTITLSRMIFDWTDPESITGGVTGLER